MVSPTTVDAPAKSTRQDILQAAFEEFHLRGYQGGSLNHIITKAGTTKGALFHHFAGKKALGLAVLDEVILPKVWEKWLTPLVESDHPVEVILECITMEGKELREGIRCGCPLCNMSQEMSPLDEEFRLRIESIYRDWRRVLEEAFERGKWAGTIGADVDPASTASFVVAAFTGIIANAKSSQDLKLVKQTVEGLQRYLTLLQP